MTVTKKVTVTTLPDGTRREVTEEVVPGGSRTTTRILPPAAATPTPAPPPAPPLPTIVEAVRPPVPVPPSPQTQSKPPAATPPTPTKPTTPTTPTAPAGRCRLTIHSPNQAAGRLYKDALARCFAGRSFCGRYWPALLCGIPGVVIALALLIAGNDDDDDDGEGGPNFLGAFVCLLIFGVLGGIFQYANRIDSMQHAVGDDGINKARRFVDEALEGRAAAAAGSHREGLLEAYDDAADEDEADRKEEGFAPGEGEATLPYAGMNAAGCLPASLVVTYDRAWASLGGRLRVAADAGDAAARDVLDLHERWLDLVRTSAGAGVAVTDAVTSQRAKAAKIAARQALGNALDAGAGAIGGLAGLADMSDLDEMRKNIKDIKGNLKDLKELKQSAPSGMASTLEEPRKGIHGIVRPLFAGQVFLISAFFVPLIAVFHVNDEPIGAWIFAIALVGSPPLFWYILKGKNEAFNALEDLVDAERVLRAALADASTRRPPPGKWSGGLVAATNAMRDEVMEEYYDTLAIHCQTGLMSFGQVPPAPEVAVPYYWSQRRRGPVTSV